MSFYIYYRCYPHFSDRFPFEGFDALPEDRIVEEFLVAVRQELFAKPERVVAWQAHLHAALARQGPHPILKQKPSPIADQRSSDVAKQKPSGLSEYKPGGLRTDRDFSGRPINWPRTIQPSEAFRDVRSVVTLGFAVGVLRWRDGLLPLDPSVFRRRQVAGRRRQGLQPPVRPADAAGPADRAADPDAGRTSRPTRRSTARRTSAATSWSGSSAG